MESLSQTRLFTAVLPPAEVVGELQERVRALPATVGVRWTEPSDWHITLAYYGTTEARLLPPLRERLEEVSRAHPAFRLGLAGGGTFRERVVWAGVAGDVDALTRLAAAAVEAGEAAGLPDRERYPEYRPHLTLAYNDDGDGAATRLRPYEKALAGFEGVPWRVGELALMRSTDAVDGPRYALVASWPLGDDRLR